jgi:hypothetical protein
MLLLQLPHFVLEVISFFQFVEGFFLSADNAVSFFENGLHFLLVGSRLRVMELSILFVLGVEMEYDFGELGYLLRHLVVRVLGRAVFGVGSCHCYEY